jgi:hypothetical protein
MLGIGNDGTADSDEPKVGTREEDTQKDVPFFIIFVRQYR